MDEAKRKEAVRKVLVDAAYGLAQAGVENFFLIASYDSRIQRVTNIPDLDELQRYLDWAMEVKRDKEAGVDPHPSDVSEVMAIEINCPEEKN